MNYKHAHKLCFWFVIGLNLCSFPSSKFYGRETRLYVYTFFLNMIISRPFDWLVQFYHIGNLAPPPKILLTQLVYVMVLIGTGCKLQLWHTYYKRMWVGVRVLHSKLKLFSNFKNTWVIHPILVHIERYPLLNFYFFSKTILQVVLCFSAQPKLNCVSCPVPVKFTEVTSNTFL